ncbi:hypothetical protein LPU83_pLPU83c_0014 (plasmid) [Rhizobium favelukesii]|uniref:Uncharacterized protein n=1 Tax=Rhizobium favelukesii TaxID=348824 RepID=W6S2D8_9HYPH|nr:hypothetical protein LPU83_pLPU83c_0014 [Rhizobium favelukesii]
MRLRTFYGSQAAGRGLAVQAAVGHEEAVAEQIASCMCILSIGGSLAFQHYSSEIDPKSSALSLLFNRPHLFLAGQFRFDSGIETELHSETSHALL